MWTKVILQFQYTLNPPQMELMHKLRENRPLFCSELTKSCSLVRKKRHWRQPTFMISKLPSVSTCRRCLHTEARLEGSALTTSCQNVRTYHIPEMSPSLSFPLHTTGDIMLTDYTHTVKRTYFYSFYWRRITEKITLTLELHLLHASHGSKHLAALTHFSSAKLSVTHKGVWT